MFLLGVLTEAAFLVYDDGEHESMFVQSKRASHFCLLVTFTKKTNNETLQVIYDITKVTQHITTLHYSILRRRLYYDFDEIKTKTNKGQQKAYL